MEDDLDVDIRFALLFLGEIYWVLAICKGMVHRLLNAIEGCRTVKRRIIKGRAE